MLRSTITIENNGSTKDATIPVPQITPKLQQQVKRTRQSNCSVKLLIQGCLVALSLMLFYRQQQFHPNNQRTQSSDNDAARSLSSKETPTVEINGGWNIMHQDAMIQKICRKQKLVDFGKSNRLDQSVTNDNKDQWTIVMTVNDGYFDFFQNWYHHFEKLNISTDNVAELVLFAEDAHSFEKLSRMFPNSGYSFTNHQGQQQKRYKVVVIPTHLEKVTGNTEEQSFSFGNWKYVTLVAKRPSRMLSVLCTGRNVLYVDADTVWKSNPLIYLNNNHRGKEKGEANDSLLSTTTADGFMIVDWVDKKLSHGYNFCTGFMAIKANRYGLEWVQSWEQRLKRKDLNQGVWNAVYSDYYKLLRAETKSSLRGASSSASKDNDNDEGSTDHVVLPLSSALFPSGREYFQTFTQEQREATVHVHANFIIGHDNKKRMLQQHGLWAVPEQPRES